MNSNQAREAYRRALGQCEAVLVRRYSGSGAGRSKVDVSCMGRPIGLETGQLVGTVDQGKIKVIILAQDVEAGANTPILQSDMIVVRGKEYAILDIDNDTRRVGGTLCAYEVTIQG